MILLLALLLALLLLLLLANPEARVGLGLALGTVLELAGTLLLTGIGLAICYWLMHRTLYHPY